MECPTRIGNRTNDHAVLEELGEWGAIGLYEALDEPWPRCYGRAYRYLYEHMDVVVPEGWWLVPFDPYSNALSWESHKVWTAEGFILDHNHNVGLRWNPNVAAEKKMRFPQHAEFIDRLTEDIDYILFQRKQGGHSGGYTHSNPDIRRVVDEGILAMEAELDEQIASMRNETAAVDLEALNLLLSLKDYAVGVRALHAHCLAAARQAAEEADAEAKPRREAVARALERAFLHPAETFLEGLLAVNLTWMLDGCDSIGRFDQALGTLFEKDLDSGELEPAFARDLLDEVWCNFERLNGWNLQIGGYTPAGKDGVNRLTRECIEACKRNKLRRPNVALRITKQTPDDVLIHALEVLREGSGRPALYNDDRYVETLYNMALGLTEEDAREIGFGGCTETMIAGMSNVGSLEGTLNLAKALELALYDGYDPVENPEARHQPSQAGPHTGRFEDFATFDDFLAAVKRQIVYMNDAFVGKNKEALRLRFHRGDPKMARTFFTRDCIRNRKSFEAGGARYNWAVVSYHGIANLIDSLAAIRHYVFETGEIGKEELLGALRTNFEGGEALRKKLLAAPKFGNDDPAVDALGRDVLRCAWESLYAHETPRGGRYLASCILFTTYLAAGRTVGATPDGRHAFDALTDSVGAAQGRDENGPTALLKSVAKLPLDLAVGTPVLNIRFQKEFLDDPEGLRGAASLVRSFFEQGGLQIQVSVLDRDELLRAQEKPEEHKDLIVRIGGYSATFVELPHEMQNSVIARTEHAL